MRKIPVPPAGGDDPKAFLLEPRRNCRADAPGSARDEGST
jgi:hypothetical protein